MIDFLLVVVILTSLVSLACYARNEEKKDWNGGVSPYDGSVWKQFDIDSQGGRGYTDETGHKIWISYGVDSRDQE